MIISSTKIHFYLIPLDSTQYYRIYDVNIYKILGHKSVKVLVAQLCLTLCDPMHCSQPGSSVHGILQARILEWVAISFSRGNTVTLGIMVHLYVPS